MPANEIGVPDGAPDPVIDDDSKHQPLEVKCVEKDTPEPDAVAGERTQNEIDGKEGDNWDV